MDTRELIPNPGEIKVVRTSNAEPLILTIDSIVIVEPTLDPDVTSITTQVVIGKGNEKIAVSTSFDKVVWQMNKQYLSPPASDEISEGSLDTRVVTAPEGFGLFTTRKSAINADTKSVLIALRSIISNEPISTNPDFSKIQLTAKRKDGTTESYVVHSSSTDIEKLRKENDLN